MSLLGIQSLSKAFGSQILFKRISFTLTQGCRVGLVGPNGCGKSTLLKILVGLEDPDEGSVTRKQGLRLGYASQSPEFPALTLEELLLQEIPNATQSDLTRARILLGKAQFTDFSQNASELSGGWKKRLDITRALMQEPDLLLLDEPTNHLDLEGIIWLEKFLLREKIAYVAVSHDRYFLENVSTKIIELNRCYPQGLFVSDGNMSDFMENKRAFLLAQEQQQQGLASIVRDEVEWLKKSPKARTTKSRSRIQNAYELIEELSQIKSRNTVHKVDIEFSASERETRKLLAGKNLSKSLGGKSLFTGVDITLSPGSRLGIVGKNGTGKTTLLKILAKMIPQDMGTVKYAEDLKFVYFDQHREHIPSNISLREALSPLSDQVNYRGQSIHVNGWARKFLFSTDRLSLPVSCLSGGERARILIARLMLQPADILFLDEPTNDLDIQTLEIIEESLKEFTGAVVLISHDRCFMDGICTQILGLGTDNEPQFFADYSQWERSFAAPPPKKEAAPKPAVAAQAENTKPKKLSYKEEKELEGMEANIEQTEGLIASLQLCLEDPTLHTDPQKSNETYQRLAEAEQKLEALFTRWEFLSSRV
ncbi:MAG: ABC-F family ATP-binding cassette domain-containing protein [Verrucomicrobia bacterium]|nr:ABC-F family ATP-binding cassette domain-containing protein [Verrucomicrobiota bacterium]